MIETQYRIKEKIKDFTDDNVYVLTDFDRTITVGNSSSSWSILSNSKHVPREYVEERKKLYDYYRPIEINEEMDYLERNRLMTEWWNKHIGLFIKYQLRKEVIDDAVLNLRVMTFRKGAKEFLESLNRRNIHVMIISAGIGNFIEQFLIQNHCNFPNIYIVANFIKFENNVAVGVSDNIIHSLNKNEVSYPIEVRDKLLGREHAILLGDSLSDIKMLDEKRRNYSLKIGFLEENVIENKDKYAQEFDLVCTDHTDYFELDDYLRELGYHLI